MSESCLEDINSVYDIGPIVARSIFDYFQDKKNLNFIDKLIKNGVHIKSTQKKELKNNISGKTFVFTGGLESMTRDDAKSKVREFGGNVSESVSSKLNYLVAGSDPGSKLDKANSLNIAVLSEKQFLELIK